LFKQIMRIEDIKGLLLASLLHDIGHFPLAHDLHEALPLAFKHEEICTNILKGSGTWEHAQTLNTMVNRDWGVSTDQIADIIDADPNRIDEPLRNRILHTIIDGPIDADKLDYLIRDSRALNVPYSYGIDLERLLNCLTVVFRPEGNHTYAALGIHEKGKIAAEAVAFARYAMFGAVYWHHTFRTVKAMLHRAVWECRRQSFPGPKGDSKLRKAFMDRFFGAAVTKSMLEEGNLNELTQVLPSDRDALDWIYNRSNEKGKELILALNERQLFKRFVVLSASKTRDIWQKMVAFRTNRDYEDMLMFQEKLQQLIVDHVRDLPSEGRKQNSILTNEKTEKVVALNNANKVLVLVDIPIDNPEEQGGSSIGLKCLPESSRHNVKEEWRKPTSLEDSAFWNNLQANFVMYTGKIRLFAHPEVADVLAAAISHDQAETLIERAMQYVTGQKK
jgi:HD superfamily phosphohydrolase